MTKRFVTTAPARETWIVGYNSALPHAYSVYLGDEGDCLIDEISQAEAYYRRHSPSSLPVVLMTPEQFEAWEDERMQARSRIEACTAEQFHDALDALPPIDWRHHSNIETFLMGEPVHSDWYQQYARAGEAYATKLVHRFRAETWMKVDDVLDANVCEEV